MEHNNINLLTNCQQSTNLVFAKNGDFFTTSETIAKGFDVQHKNVLKLVEKYQDKIERFGALAFETLPLQNGGLPKRVALFNKSQSMFFMTLLRNNDLVVDFKVRLVEEFEKLAKQVTTTALPDFTDPEQVLLFTLEKVRENKKLLAITQKQANTIELQKPMVEFADVIIESDDTSPINEATKKIANYNQKFTPNKTRDLMKIKGLLILNEYNDYMPSATMTANGYMQYKLVRTWFDDASRKTRQQWQVRITGKGLEMMLRLCKNYTKFFDCKFEKYEYYLRNPNSEQTKEFLSKMREPSTNQNDLFI